MFPTGIGNLLQGNTVPSCKIVIVCIPTGHLPVFPKRVQRGLVVLIHISFSGKAFAYSFNLE